MKIDINIKLDLDLPEDRDKYKIISKILDNPFAVNTALDNFYNQTIRPAFKHGYPDLESKLAKIEQEHPELVYKIMDIVWNKFVQSMEDEDCKIFLGV